MTKPIIALLVSLIICFIPNSNPHPIEILRAPQSIEDIRIDIVDSRVNKNEVQIIIYYQNCTDRLNLKKNQLENFKKLQNAINEIITLRKATGGCKL